MTFHEINEYIIGNFWNERWLVGKAIDETFYPIATLVVNCSASFFLNEIHFMFSGSSIFFSFKILYHQPSIQI